MYDCPGVVIIIIITSIYVALFPSQWPRSKCRPFIITGAIRKSSQSFRLIQACCEAIPHTAYQHLDCNITPNSVPNIALVNEARKVEWITQAYNMLAVAGLELTTFGLWVLQVSSRPHMPSKVFSFDFFFNSIQFNSTPWMGDGGN